MKKLPRAQGENLPSRGCVSEYPPALDILENRLLLSAGSLSDLQADAPTAPAVTAETTFADVLVPPALVLKVWLECDAITAGDSSVSIWAQVLNGAKDQGLSDLTLTIYTPDASGGGTPKSGSVPQYVATQWNPEVQNNFLTFRASPADYDGDGDLDAVDMSIRDLGCSDPRLGVAPVLLATQIWTFQSLEEPTTLAIEINGESRYWQSNSGGTSAFSEVRVSGVTVTGKWVLGDLNHDYKVDDDDIDLLYAHLGETGSRYDLNGDNLVNQADVDLLVTQKLMTRYGDANLDGVVNFKDFQALLNNWHRPGTWSTGDFTGEGSVTFDDFQQIMTNWLRVRETVGGDRGEIGSGGTSAYDIDIDGDSYGVGPDLLGPDADDTDPTVNTLSSALAKYASLQDLLAVRGYHPLRLIFVSPYGEDHTGVVGDINQPFRTWEAVRQVLQPGDCVLFRSGTWWSGTGQDDSAIKVDSNSPSGTADNPIIVMAMPGEKVYLSGSASDARTHAIWYSELGYYIFDGFITSGATDMSCGVKLAYGAHDLIIRNMHISNSFWGIQMSGQWSNIEIASSVIHDTHVANGEHGIYVGAPADVYSSSIHVHDNLIYNTGNSSIGQGIHMNGRITGALVENNIIHSTGTTGIDLMNGVTQSTFQNNLIFDSPNAQDFIISNYSGGATDPGAPMDDLQIINNTFISTSEISSRRTAIRVNVNDFSSARNLHIANNVLDMDYVGASGTAVIQFDNSLWWTTAIIENNLVYNANSDSFLRISGVEYNLAQVQLMSPLIRNNYWALPEFRNYAGDLLQWRFDLLDGSPGTGMANAALAPMYDLRYIRRDMLPDVGAYK